LKVVYVFQKRLENSWPFDKFQVYVNFVFQVVFKIEKRETEVNDWFSFF
jgi:hypothetical protein